MSEITECCKFSRPKEVCDEKEKPLYNAGMVAADTMWCHHLDDAGKHIVLNGLDVASARQCQGVMYVSMGFRGKSITCGAMRPKGKGHDRCHKGVCPYLAAGQECPFMANAPESVPNAKAPE